jgi:hypothetical protein
MSKRPLEESRRDVKQPSDRLTVSGRQASLVALVGAVLLVPGCGNQNRDRRSPGETRAAGAARVRPRLIADRRPLSRLPVPLQRTASATSGGRLVVAGGLNAAGGSVTTVTAIPLDGGTPQALSPLPQAVHDAAAAGLGASVTAFGGGQAEGTRAIVRVLPGPARVTGALPRPLSDAAAVAIGSAVYVAGGWDGVRLDARVYRYRPGGSPAVAGHLATGVRYPAIGALSGKLLVAGGTTAGGAATSLIQSFDPTSGGTARVGRLPYSVSDAGGAVLGGRFYVIGGLREGRPTREILAWAPGERRATPAGRLPRPLSDLSAVATSNAVAVAGGRAVTGPVADVLLLRPRGAR